jgi:PST family polysaccharide transporter
LAENIGSLLLIQVLNYVLPFFVFPYLVRVLGVERFGAIAFASAAAQYAALLMNFSFAITATREISEQRDNLDSLANIFWTVTYSKLLLAIISGIMLFSLSAVIPNLSKELGLITVAFGLVFAETLFPMWFFQGVEQMKVITVIHFLTRAIYTLCVFWLIKSQSDDVLCLSLQAISQAVGSAIGFLSAWRIKPLKIMTPSVQDIFFELKKGWTVFLSQVGVNLFNSANLMILGLMSTTEQVGLYAIADKVARAGIMMSAPLTNGIFPHVNRLFARSTQEALTLLRKTAAYGGIAFLILSAGLFVWADVIASFITGKENDAIALLIRILSPLPLTVFLDNIFGTQILLNLRFEKEFMRSILTAGLISIGISVVLVPKIAAVGTAISFLSAGIVVLSLVYLNARNRGIRLFASNK